MIPTGVLPFGGVTLLVGLLALALIVMAILGVFKNNLYNRLSTRIITLIFASSLVAIIVTTALSEPLNSTGHTIRWHVLQIALIGLGGPVVLGLLAARFVRRPLRQFNDAVASLEKNDYKVQLQPTGISEFDEVFTKFNHLIQQLQHEEKLRKDLVSDTSHELNTPLTIMIGQLTAIEEGAYSMTPERVAMLKAQAERLASLVSQLDAYTKARMPRHGTGRRDAISLEPFCKELTHRFARELKQQGMQLHLHIAKDCVVRADRGVLEQILTNFIQNTLRYSGATDCTIAATAHELVFSDNGKGVPDESLPYLFERFYRVESSRNQAAGGLGLGLAIVRELAESQGWKIAAQAGHPGLRFTIQF